MTKRVLAGKTHLHLSPSHVLRFRRRSFEESPSNNYLRQTKQGFTHTHIHHDSDSMRVVSPNELWMNPSHNMLWSKYVTVRLIPYEAVRKSEAHWNFKLIARLDQLLSVDAFVLDYSQCQVADLTRWSVDKTKCLIHWFEVSYKFRWSSHERRTWVFFPSIELLECVSSNEAGANSQHMSVTIIYQHERNV